MDWFLYDRGLRHERVKLSENTSLELQIQDYRDIMKRFYFPVENIQGLFKWTNIATENNF